MAWHVCPTSALATPSLISEIRKNAHLQLPQRNEDISRLSDPVGKSATQYENYSSESNNIATWIIDRS